MGRGREGIWCLTSTASARLSLICGLCGEVCCGKEATEDEDTAELMTPHIAYSSCYGYACVTCDLRAHIVSDIQIVAPGV